MTGVKAEVEQGQIMTANRLRDGAVVFLTRSGQWHERLDEADLVQEPHAKLALEQRAQADEMATLITGSYFFDAERVNGSIRALHMRERIRALGPTVRADLGKQAEGTAGSFPFKEDN